MSFFRSKVQMPVERRYQPFSRLWMMKGCIVALSTLGRSWSPANELWYCTSAPNRPRGEESIATAARPACHLPVPSSSWSAVGAVIIGPMPNCTPSVFTRKISNRFRSPSPVL
ncbi:hypothetical protein D3C80_1749170 [compost metagenome]